MSQGETTIQAIAATLLPLLLLPEFLMPTSTAFRSDRIGEGIAFIVASVFAMALSDSLVKYVGGSMPLWQVLSARSIIAILVLALIMVATKTSFRTKAPGWTLLRSAFLVLCWLFFYASFPVLDLSVAAVAMYSAPIMIALLSALFLGEPVGARGWLGVMLGFAGVIAILKPGTDAFSWFALLPVAGALFYAIAMLLTGTKCKNDPPSVLSIALHGTFLVCGLAGTAILALLRPEAETVDLYPFLLSGWDPAGAIEWILLTVIGVMSALYFLGVARAYQIAPPTVIATFDYCYLISAALWGYVIFAEMPGPLTVFGMVLITIAGLLVATRPGPGKPA